MLRKILRIDVDQIDAGKNYAVPDDNPFVSDSSFLPEIWAYGLRNPWKISFDRENGDLYMADVGRNLWEEVNHHPASRTGRENYGWRLIEGTSIFVADYVTGTMFIINQCRDKKNYYFKIPKRTCEFISKSKNVFKNIARDIKYLESVKILELAATQHARRWSNLW